ncbi:MAG: histidine phosphatase family protein [Clostridiales bacterium]|nr:histidine phosphatase family protein [Clostridiales bacterium]
MYVVRHGQTDSNKRNACIGRKDIPLNAAGLKQADELLGKLREIPFDVIYTSPLQRAIDTITPFIRLRSNTKLVMNYGIIERDFGSWDDMTFGEIKAAYPEEYKLWRDNWLTYRVPGGESDEELFKRTGETVRKILDMHEGERVLIVTHLGAARHIISHLLGFGQEESWHFFLDNTGIAVIDVDDEKKGVLKGLNI